MKVNLPVLNRLFEDESTYITFSSANNDFDKATFNKTEFYFSRMVAIELPKWEEGVFYHPSNSEQNISSVTEATNDPNLAIPKYIQHYTENLIRNGVSAEIAFWKTLNLLSVKKPPIRNYIRFMNNIIVSNYEQLVSPDGSEINNVGWGSIICQIPTDAYRQVIVTGPAQVEGGTAPGSPAADIIVSQNFVDDPKNRGIYDNGDHQFLMQGVQRIMFNVEPIPTNDQLKSFKFNALLIFYKDRDGIEKLHGINFLKPYVNTVGSWEIPPFEFTVREKTRTNIGYQFILHMKTCNNEASLIKIQENYQQNNWYPTMEVAFDKLNKIIHNFPELTPRHV